MFKFKKFGAAILGGWGGFMGVVTDANATYPLITTTMVNEFGDMLDMTDDCGDVRCGGFGDFIDIEIDDQGRPWVALAHNVHNEEAIIGTWTTGPSLYGDDITMLDVLPAGGNSTLKM